MHQPSWILLAVGLAVANAAVAKPPLEGRKAQEWQVEHWINSAPLTLDQLKGEVILVRWWTAPGCPYCQASAPALNEFHRKYEAGGLKVLGFYHHKSAAPLDVATVKQHVTRFQFEFPVAIDAEWRTLRRWWLHQNEQQWTSVTFLIDRRGVIRHIHPGGQYVKGDEDYQELEGKIRELLAGTR